MSVAPLIAIALERPAAAYDTFLTWDYLFRRGSVRGCEDLAHAIAELFWTLLLKLTTGTLASSAATYSIQTNA